MPIHVYTNVRDFVCVCVILPDVHLPVATVLWPRRWHQVAEGKGARGARGRCQPVGVVGWLGGWLDGVVSLGNSTRTLW